jgi:hypothetical protein
MSDAVSLDLIMRKLDQLIQDNGIFRDDMRVQSAIIMRLDTTMAALLTEVRTLHAQIDRVGNRVRTLPGDGGHDVLSTRPDRRRTCGAGRSRSTQVSESQECFSCLVFSASPCSISRWSI